MSVRYQLGTTLNSKSEELDNQIWNCNWNTLYIGTIFARKPLSLSLSIRLNPPPQHHKRRETQRGDMVKSDEQELQDASSEDNILSVNTDKPMMSKSKKANQMFKLAKKKVKDMLDGVCNLSLLV